MECMDTLEARDNQKEKNNTKKQTNKLPFLLRFSITACQTLYTPVDVYTPAKRLNIPKRNQTTTNEKKKKKDKDKHNSLTSNEIKITINHF